MHGHLIIEKQTYWLKSHTRRVAWVAVLTTWSKSWRIFELSSYVCNLVTLDFLTAFSPLASALALVSSVPTQSFAQNTRIMATHGLVAEGQSPASNPSGSQAEAGAGIPSPGSFPGVIWCPHPLQQEGKNKKRAGSSLSLSLCDRDDHPCPFPFVLSASKSYGENQNKPRKV